jgi:hypothetical protein
MADQRGGVARRKVAVNIGEVFNLIGLAHNALYPSLTVAYGEIWVLTRDLARV